MLCVCVFYIKKAFDGFSLHSCVMIYTERLPPLKQEPLWLLWK